MNNRCARQGVAVGDMWTIPRVPSRSGSTSVAGAVCLCAMVGRASVCSVDVGAARGWDVSPLENGDWAWNAWIASSLGLPRSSGIAATEAEAQAAAQRELERMVSESEAAAQERRELPVRDERGRSWGPQS